MIDKRFNNKILNNYGPKGEIWLHQLSSILRSIENLWDIEIEKVCDDLSYNLVAITKQKTILKVGPDKDEIENEAKCLKAYNGKSSCLLLEYSLDFGALHLEKLGDNLYSQKHIPDNVKTEICAKVIKNLPKEFEDISLFKKINDWLMRLEQRYKTHNINKKMLDKAFSLSKDLIQSSEKLTLLHGDLHHKNILRDSMNNWRIIDPKGVIGDPVYEVGAFIRNPIPDIFNHNNLTSIIENRIDIFKDILGYDTQRMSAWSFVQSVLAWIWFIDSKDKNALGIENIVYALNKIYK